ncbi:MAG: FAD-dependent oxidoreductase [Anaerolineae bacterium]|jgi:carotenoid phi-ring synthase / carotenoid chi-ring synthase|nr:FAD-dependent oxidoreductase [Anaerolineae bacterium]MBT7192170.1 FAD-dependent oxidoreductase [Anaerolineae bacterium]MBT7989509.1 FAD-dependent oxidoreductase [Anaerolineae bacterium]
MAQDKNHDTIIIGGGVAGLSAALHLAERGLHPLVLEADPEYLGGRLAGGEIIEVNGYEFRLEHGVHGIWSQYRNFQAMLARHNLRPVFVPAEEETWIYRKGNVLKSAKIGSTIRRSFLPPPFHYLALFLRPSFLWMLDIRDLLSLPLTWAGLVMGIGIDPFAESQPMEGLTLGDMTKKWSPALRALFLGLARNGLASHPAEVPMSGFLAFLRFYTLLRRDAWVFSYLPEDGGTSICEPLGDRIRNLNGSIFLGASVTQVIRERGEWLVVWETAQGQESARAQHLILATDSKNAENLIEENLNPDELFFPRSLANAVIRLWFDAHPKAGAEAGIFTGEFTLHNYFWLDKLSNPFRRWARETGGSAIEAHIYGPDEVLAQPDAILLAQAIQDMQRVWPELRGHRIFAHIQRNPATHTLPAVGAKDKHLGTVTPWKNLFCAGDWVQHPAPAFFIERACLTGIEAANAVLQSLNIEPWPLLAYLPPEPLAAWIENLMQLGRGKIRRKRNRG